MDDGLAEVIAPVPGGDILMSLTKTKKTKAKPRRLVRAAKIALLGVSSLTVCSTFTLSNTAYAKTSASKVQISIPAQSMETALNSFAKQIGKQIIFYSEDAKKLRAGPVSGAFTEQEALWSILGKSGLEYIYVNKRTIGIRRKTGAASLIATGYQTQTGGNQSSTSQSDVAESSASGTEIVVIGRARDQQLSIEAKREAKQVVDVLTADEASKLPDTNVAESLSRISGVSVVRSGETGEGNFISLRGLDSALVNIQFDGVTSGQSSSANRSVALDGISSDNIAEISVAKSLLPSDEGVGVGGAVRIKSRTPLDGGKDRITIEGGGRYGEFADKLGYDIGGSITKIFSDSFGISLSASYRTRFIKNLEIDSSSSKISGLAGVVDAAGNTLTPQEIIDAGLDDSDNSFDNVRAGLIPASAIVFEDQSYQLQEQQRNRLTLTGALDWRPSDTTLLTLGGRYSREKTKATEFSLTFDHDDDGFFAQNGLLLTRFDDAELDFEAQLEDELSVNALAYLKGVTETGDIKLEYQVSYAHARRKSPQTDILLDSASLIDRDSTGANGGPEVQFHPYTFQNRYFPVPSAAGTAGANFANLINNLAGTQSFDDIESVLINENSNDRYAGQVDLTYLVDQEFLGGSITNIQIGAKYERSDLRDDEAENVDTDRDFVNVDGTYDPDGNGTAGEFLLNNAAGLYGGLDGNSLSFVGSPLRSIGLSGLPVLNDAAFRSFVGNFNSSYTGDIDVDFFDAREETFAGYFQANVEIGNFDMSGGVRVEHYKGSFASPLELIAQLQLVDAADQRNIRLSGTNLLDTVNSSAENTEILPRFNARYKATDDFQIRFGAGYSLARPTFSQLGAATNIGITLEADAGAGPVILPGVTDAAGLVAAGGVNLNQITQADIGISSGNPDLKNARSLNLDLSFEYYPMRGTALTFGLFHKRIKNFIFRGQESASGTLNADFIESLLSADGQTILNGLGGLDTIVSQGVNTDISIRQPTNGALAKISGVEFGVSHLFDYLPGFMSNMGMNANITYTDSDATYVLIPGASALNPDDGLADDEAEVVLGYANAGDALIRQTSFFRSPEITANGTLFYEDDALEIALSGSYQTESFAATDDYGLDQFTASYFQLDLFVGYTLPIPKNYGDFKLFFEIPDITDGGRKPTDLQTVGRSRTAFDEASFNGREFRFGLRGRF